MKQKAIFFVGMLLIVLSIPSFVFAMGMSIYDEGPDYIVDLEVSIGYGIGYAGVEIGSTIGAAPFVMAKSFLFDSFGGITQANASAAYFYDVDFFSGLRDQAGNILPDYQEAANSLIPATVTYELAASQYHEGCPVVVADSGAHAVLRIYGATSSFYKDTELGNHTVGGWTVSGTDSIFITEGYLRVLIIATANSVLNLVTSHDLLDQLIEVDSVTFGAAAYAYADPVFHVDPNYEFYDLINISYNQLDPMECSVGEAAALVPEPSTFLLLGSGLAGLAFYRRKRK